MGVCILIYDYRVTDVLCCVYSAHTYTKFHEIKSDTIHEVFPTRNMTVGISPTVNTLGLMESSAMGLYRHCHLSGSSPPK